MKILLIPVVTIGVAALMDATQFKGSGRAALWRNVQHQGQLIDAGVTWMF
jgi:hypothetical protein